MEVEEEQSTGEGGVVLQFANSGCLLEAQPELLPT